MGLFDSLTKLGETTAQRAVNQAASYVVGSIGSKVAEAESVVAKAFGISNPFSKAGVSLPGAKKDPTNTNGSPSAAIAAQESKNSYKVILADGNDKVEFDVMPEINESHAVGYEPVAPSQHVASFQKYKGTESVTWGLTITLISRSPKEAAENLVRLNTLRGWTMPFFGVNTGNTFQGKLGAPPPVLKLSGLRDLIGPVPVVITSLHWMWPKDVDYLATGSGKNAIPFPAVMNINIDLIESYSTTEINSFSLADFRKGDMVAAFSGKLKSLSVEGGNEKPPPAPPSGTDVSGDSIRTARSLAPPIVPFKAIKLPNIRNSIAIQIELDRINASLLFNQQIITNAQAKSPPAQGEIDVVNKQNKSLNSRKSELEAMLQGT
jgi:hypothetical protein